MEFLKTGKLQSEFLEHLLGRIEIRDPSVVVGPGIGEDAAVLKCSDRYLIVKSDPITFAADRIGWYAVNVNANDIAAMGGIPRWFLVTMLLPQRSTTTALIEEIMNDLRKACGDIGVSLIGGHTEITHGLENPILSGTMLGETDSESLIRKSIGEGDLLYITKGVAIEATSIIARERRDEVTGCFGEKIYEKCRRFLEDPGISVLREARIAVQSARVTGMHDPTEGGVLAGVYEMARCASVGVELDLDAIPVYDETRSLCRAFGLSPYGSIASGALLIAVPRAEGEKLERGFSREALSLRKIGGFTTVNGPLIVRKEGREEELKPVMRDEITKLWEE